MKRSSTILAAAALAVGVAIPPAAVAETLMAARMIRAQTVLSAEDVRMGPDTIAGALEDPGDAIGREARVNLYPGRPIRARDLGAPATVERNQLITLNYHRAGLSIVTEGRALARGGPGDRIRVMNLASRQTVIGTVLVDGTINVAPARY